MRLGDVEPGRWIRRGDGGSTRPIGQVLAHERTSTLVFACRHSEVPFAGQLIRSYLAAPEVWPATTEVEPAADPQLPLPLE